MANAAPSVPLFEAEWAHRIVGGNLARMMNMADVAVR
jgi:hypothetical protein